MKQLVEHLWRENSDWITENSLIHCHTKHLDSIVLMKNQNQLIRLYFASPECDLFQDNYMREEHSIGIHSHHCNLTLHCIKGKLHNVSFELSKREGRYDAFQWCSGVTGEGKFKWVDFDIQLNDKKHTTLFPGDSVYMQANELHTVECEGYESCAWLVYEGAEDPNYNPVTYSREDLTYFDPKGLYVKPTKQEVYKRLQWAGLLN
jgi:hypothetical protein